MENDMDDEDYQEELNRINAGEKQIEGQLHVDGGVVDDDDDEY